MIHYLLQTIAFQLLFLLVYDVFLKKETFFNINRLYLIITPILSFLIPFIRVEKVQQFVPEQYMISIPPVLLGENAEVNAASEAGITFDWAWILYIGAIISLSFLIYRLYSIWKLKRQSETTRFPGYNRVVVKNEDLAFSFFKNIFLGQRTFKNEHDHIIQHELIHIKQRHSYDLLFFELLRVVCWFNPMIYIYQKRIAELHEFIADSVMTKSVTKHQYCEHLLQEAFQTQNISFVNQFFNHSLIKKRITMLQKSKSKGIFKLKYLMLVPLLALMLFYTSCQEVSAATPIDSFFVNENDRELVQKLKEIRQEILDGKETFETMALFYSMDPGSKGNGGYYEVTKDAPFVKEFLDVCYNLKKGEISEPFKTGFGWHIVRVEEINGDTRGVRHILLMSDKQKQTLDNRLQEERKVSQEEWVTEFKEGYDDQETEIPFAKLEKAPVYPGCENAEDQKKCFSQSVTKMVSTEFNIKLAEGLGLEGRQRISAIFKIDKKGNIIDMKVDAPHPRLKEETERVLSKLPKMEAGEHKGKKVKVVYSLPIVFQVSK